MVWSYLTVGDEPQSYQKYNTLHDDLQQWSVYESGIGHRSHGYGNAQTWEEAAAMTKV